MFFNGENYCPPSFLRYLKINLKSSSIFTIENNKAHETKHCSVGLPVLLYKFLQVRDRLVLVLQNGSLVGQSSLPNPGEALSISLMPEASLGKEFF